MQPVCKIINLLILTEKNVVNEMVPLGGLGGQKNQRANYRQVAVVPRNQHNVIQQKQAGPRPRQPVRRKAQVPLQSRAPDGQMQKTRLAGSRPGPGVAAAAIQNAGKPHSTTSPGKPSTQAGSTGVPNGVQPASLTDPSGKPVGIARPTPAAGARPKTVATEAQLTTPFGRSIITPPRQAARMQSNEPGKVQPRSISKLSSRAKVAQSRAPRKVPPESAKQPVTNPGTAKPQAGASLGPMTSEKTPRATQVTAITPQSREYSVKDLRLNSKNILLKENLQMEYKVNF